jgi:anti-sigma regulatory factor (Ser/Thr protein kinase)
MTEPDPHGFCHRAVVYDSAEDFAEAIVPFARAGIEAGEPVILVATEENIAAVRRELGRDAAAVACFDAQEWYSVPWHVVRRYRRWLEGSEGRRARVIGEQTWLEREAPDVREWKRYEAFANVTFASGPNTVMCTYDARVLPDAYVDDVYRTHRWVRRGGGWTTSTRYVEPERFAADLDRDALEPPRGSVDEAPLGTLGATRAAAARGAAAAGVPPERVEDLVFAVNEMARNVIDHAGGDGTVRTWAADGRFFCEIADHGPGIADPLAGQWTPAGPDAPGWGLWTARQLCDLVEVRSGGDGTVVRLRMTVA